MTDLVLKLMRHPEFFLQAIENMEGGPWWGMLQVPYHTGDDLKFSKQYFAMLQYSRFIRNGYGILPLKDVFLFSLTDPLVLPIAEKIVIALLMRWNFSFQGKAMPTVNALAVQQIHNEKTS